MIYCPHCSRSIESHDGRPCPRKFSRRFLFGLLAAGAAVVAVGAKAPLPMIHADWGDPDNPSILVTTVWDRGRGIKTTYVNQRFVSSEAEDFPFVFLDRNRPEPDWVSRDSQVRRKVLVAMRIVGLEKP